MLLDDKQRRDYDLQLMYGGHQGGGGGRGYNYGRGGGYNEQFFNTRFTNTNERNRRNQFYYHNFQNRGGAYHNVHTVELSMNEVISFFMLVFAILPIFAAMKNFMEVQHPTDGRSEEQSTEGGALQQMYLPYNTDLFEKKYKIVLLAREFDSMDSNMTEMFQNVARGMAREEKFQFFHLRESEHEVFSLYFEVGVQIFVLHHKIGNKYVQYDGDYEEVSGFVNHLL